MLTTIALLFSLVATPPTRDRALVVGPPADSARADRDIRLAALRNVADVRRCYEREGLTRDPGLAGMLEVTVTVLPTGIVSEAVVTAKAMRGFGAGDVESCLTTAMRNWRFDRGPYAIERIVFPFRFSPEGPRYFPRVDA
jgi:hypothetical protein